jgi:hypothetical protein
MRLYEIPKGSKILIEKKVRNGTVGDVLIYYALDGVNSFCPIDTTKSVHHLGAFTRVIKVGDYYKLEK